MRLVYLDQFFLHKYVGKFPRVALAAQASTFQFHLGLLWDQISTDMESWAPTLCGCNSKESYFPYIV